MYNFRGRFSTVASSSKTILLLAAFFMVTALQAQQKKWTLQTADTKLVLGLGAKNALRLFELRSGSAGYNWVAGSTTVPMLQHIEVDGRPLQTTWNFKNSTVSTKEGTTLTITFTNREPAMELTTVWEAKKGPGPVRNRQYLKNNSGKTITIYAPESIDLTVNAPQQNTSLIYINDDASAPDSVGVYHKKLIGPRQDTLRISEVHDWIPFMALNAGDKYGMYIGWEWSIGRMAFQKHASAAAHFKAGISDSFKTDIDAGETFDVPPAFIGTYTGDFDACGNSLRKYLFQNAMPALVRQDNTFPKTQWNAFAALGKEQGSWDPVEAKYYPLVDDITPLGFEELVIDIGWWSSYGDPGHIIVDSVDWPLGIPAAAKYAKDRGIRFGLYDNESENLTSDSGKSERIRDVSYLIQKLGADFYRSDNTAGPVIAGNYGPGQRARYKEDMSYWSIKGFYEVIDSLYKILPGFLWENCSSGGGLKDFGAVQRCARIQNQDIYWPVEARRSFYDASHIFPPMQLASVVGSWAPWQATGSVYEFRSASMGAAYWHPDAPNGGNGGPVWTDAHKDSIKKAVATYKEKLRPLIRSGNVYHIFPRPDGNAWDGVQYFDPESRKGVVYMFKPGQSAPQYTLKLKGLNVGDNYKLTFEDGSNKTQVVKGSVLMSKGIVVTLDGTLRSELMFIEKV
jgi:alpha-galactosidase